MARIKFSPIITDIKGKLGNAVFQGSQGGSILRTRVKPNDKKTPAQIKARERMQEVKSEWQNLTANQRGSWEALAGFMRQRMKNDQTKILSAYNLFLQSNIVRLLATTQTVLETTLSTSTVLGYTVEISQLLPDKFLFYAEVNASDPSTCLAVYMSAPFRISAKIPDSKVRYMYYSCPPFGDVDITQLYLDKFGKLPTQDQKIRVKLVPLFENDGWIGKPTFMDIFYS